MTDIILDKNIEELSGISAQQEREQSEEYMTRRFMRPARRLENVIYEVTKDEGYLHQYYMLRGEMYVKAFGTSHFCGKEDEHDAASDHIVARIGNQVIGGCRITYSNPASPRRLPMEKSLLLADVMPEVPLEDIIHAEISRMAILPEYQNSLAMLELIRQMFIRGAQRKARYAFALAPLTLARNYRKAVALFGYEWQIRRDIKTAANEYDGLPMVLSVIDLSQAYQPMEKTSSITEDDSMLMA